MLKAMFGVTARPISFDAVLHGNLLTLVDMSGSKLMRMLIPALAWIWLLPNSMHIRFVRKNATLAGLYLGFVRFAE